MGAQRMGGIVLLVGYMVVVVRARHVRPMLHGMQLPNRCKHWLHEHGEGKQQQCCFTRESAAEPEKHFATIPRIDTVFQLASEIAILADKLQPNQHLTGLGRAVRTPVKAGPGRRPIPGAKRWPTHQSEHVRERVRRAPHAMSASARMQPFPTPDNAA
ncbi:hypothetical protein GCM10011394_14330 [Luteimonas terricola]|uniref:Secreted protein n=1 Tax=Luteimonas terricola TaxID=645597 RepID=A0ABQ2ECK4_9GAMM|nr:hypothetical protein GCM10011394_14330 [Luteimonas terricola]